MSRHGFVLVLGAFLLASPTTASGAEVWVGDFETGDLSQWSFVLNGDIDGTDYAFAQTGLVSEGTYGGRIELHNDAVWPNGLKRVELQHRPSDERTAEGATTWFAWSFYLPEALPSDPSQQIGYWESTNSFQQMMAFQVEGENISFATRQPMNVVQWQADGVVTPGEWHRIAMGVTWSTDPGQGAVDVWFDGMQVVDQGPARTLADDNPHFVQLGLLRGQIEFEDVPIIIIDDAVEGDSLEDVRPDDLPSEGGDSSGSGGGMSDTSGGMGDDTTGGSPGNDDTGIDTNPPPPQTSGVTSPDGGSGSGSEGGNADGGDEDAGGCGCSSGRAGFGGTAWGLALLMLVRRRRRRSGLAGLVAATLTACGTPEDPEGGAEEGSTTVDDGGTRGEGSTGPTSGMMDSADTGSGTDPGSTTDEPPDPPPPTAACADRELPLREGAEILVAPGPDGTVVVDGNSTTLRQVVSSAASGDTILLQDGTYVLPEAGSGEYTGLYFTTPDVTLRSESGDAQAVVIDGGYVSQGNGSAPITIDATGVVVADLTVQRSIFHLIHIWADGDGALVHGVHMVDGGQQFLKSSVDGGTVDDVEVSCSRFVMTDQGRDNVWGYGPQGGNTTCYTGGIDTHNARDWYVHDSHFEGIFCDAAGVQRPAHGQFPEQRDGMTYNGGLSEHAIHMWDSEAGSGHTIARNRIVDCARGIGIGLVDTVYGTSVVNNMVTSVHAGSGEHDVGIIVERAVDTLVAHNSVVFTHPDAYANAIEYRWGETSDLTLHGNLTNRAITARDGATASTSDDRSDAVADWFVDPATGDLHLVDCGAPGSAASITEVTDDFDGEARSDPTTPGADACPP